MSTAILRQGRFHNPPGSPSAQAGALDFARFLLRLRRLKTPLIPQGHVLSPDAVRVGLSLHQGGDALTWLGHATFLISLNKHLILTDPFLGDYASPVPWLGPKRFVAPALPVSELPRIDVMLVSHNHYDHLDASTVAALPFKDQVSVVVPLKLGAFFRQRGYPHVYELDWYASVTVGGLIITAVPAIHFSRRGLWDARRTLWSGFVVRAQGQGQGLYFAGDTAYGPVLRELGPRVGPIHLALLPIAAYAPRAIMQAVHMNPEEAARLAVDVGAQVAVAMHWGTIVLTEEPPFEPPVRFQMAMAKAGFAPEQVWIMRIGETRPMAVPKP